MNKTEHSNLIEISKVISFELPYNMYFDGVFIYKQAIGSEDYIVDVREIIFTPEFMLKLKLFLSPLETKKPFTYGFIEVRIGLLQNLNAPVTYLYKALGLGEK